MSGIPRSMLALLLVASVGCDGDAGGVLPTHELQVIVYDSVFTGGQPARPWNEAPRFTVRMSDSTYVTSRVEVSTDYHRRFVQALSLTLPQGATVDLEVGADGYASRTVRHHVPKSEGPSQLLVPLVPQLPTLVDWNVHAPAVAFSAGDTLRLTADIWDVQGGADVTVDSVVIDMYALRHKLLGDELGPLFVDGPHALVDHAWEMPVSGVLDYSQEVRFYLRDASSAPAFTWCSAAQYHRGCDLTDY